MYFEIESNDVNKWIERDAQKAFDLYMERGDGNDCKAVYDATDNTMTYYANMLAIIAWGDISACFTGDSLTYEETPAARYEQAVFDRFYELVEDNA